MFRVNNPSTIANGSITPAMLTQPLTLTTSVASTSGKAIDFENIPTWVNLIFANFHQVSLNGTANIRIQLGTVEDGVITTGYLNTSSNNSNGSTNTISSQTTGFNLTTGTAANLHQGLAIFSKVGGNTWAGLLNASLSNSAQSILSAGSITLPNRLSRIRFTTSNGTDDFDGGLISLTLL